MATTATPWCGSAGDKLFLQSGQFTSTVKDSEPVTGVDTDPRGISWDGTNTPWTGNYANKLYLQSGQFTSTVKTSQSVSGVDTGPNGVSWDGTNTPWSGSEAAKLYLQSGQFTSTVKTSEDVSGVDTAPNDMSYDGTNTPWIGFSDKKLYLQSGQFTATVKDSQSISGVDTTPDGISWDGTNTPWSGGAADKLYLQSGQFTSTMKTSEDVSGIDSNVQGIDTDDVNARLGIGSSSSSSSESSSSSSSSSSESSSSSSSSSSESSSSSSSSITPIIQHVTTPDTRVIGSNPVAVTTNSDGTLNLACVVDSTGGFLETDEEIIIGGTPITLYRSGENFAIGFIRETNTTEDTDNVMLLGNSFQLDRKNDKHVLRVDSISKQGSTSYLTTWYGRALCGDENRSMILVEKTVATGINTNEGEAIIGNMPLKAIQVSNRWYLAARII